MEPQPTTADMRDDRRAHFAEAEALTQLGLAALARAAPGVALEHFLAASRADPGHLKASLEAAQALRLAGRLDDAAACLAAIALVVPDNPWIAFQLGKLAAARGEPLMALRHFHDACSRDPENVWAALDAAQLLEDHERSDQAATLLRATLAHLPTSVPLLVRLGRLSRLEGAWPEAMGYLRVARRIAPDDVWVALETAEAMQQQGRVDIAHSLLHHAAAIHRDAPLPVFRLGHLALQRGDRAWALHLFRTALAIDPTMVWAALDIASTLEGDGQPDAATGILQDALAHHPGNLLVRRGLARLARRAGRHADAVDHIRVAVAAAPGDPKALAALAQEYRAQGRFEEAEAVATQLIALVPTAPDGTIERGLTARATGDHLAALAAFQTARALHPELPQTLVEIATEERALGRPRAAETALRTALRLSPRHTPAILQLGDLQLLAEDYAACLDTCQQALVVQPMEPWLHYLEARARLGTEGPEAALAKLQSAAEAVGQQPAFLALRLDVLRQIGRIDLIRDMLPQCRKFAESDSNLWAQTQRFELGIGGFAVVRAALPTRAVADREEASQVEGVRGALAEAEWRLPEAAIHYRAALQFDPASGFMAQELARVLMLMLEIADAEAALGQNITLDATSRRLRGASLNVSQTHLGQLLDEFKLDREALAALRAVRMLPASQRVAPLQAVVLAYPDYTPAAMALLLALRGAGRFSVPPAAGAPAIPRQIGQFWMQPDVPTDIAALMESWRVQNPAHHYRLFNHGSACTFLRAKADPMVLDAYMAARLPAQRADLFRLAWLYAEGGVYADADDRCHRPLDRLGAGAATFVAYQEEYTTLGNNFLACTPGHPVIGRALRDAAAALIRGDSDLLWLSTGPGLLTRAFAQELSAARPDAAGWFASIVILERWQLAEAVSCHCQVSYKQTDKHWSRSEFARRQVRSIPGHDNPPS